MEKFPSYPPPEAENKEPLFVRAHEKAETVLEIDKLSFEDFENSEIYASGIEADKKEVERLEGLFEENRQRQGPENYDKAKKLGTILEGLIHEQAELSEWFGEDCQMINTNEFDDYKNGIDSVAAFGSAASGSFVGANFDVTFTNNPQNKLDRIADDIREKRLGTVKYFAYENFKGELNNVAKAVLMVDIDSLKELSELWVDGKKRTLGSHPIQLQLIDQVIAQGKAFAELAANNDFPEGEKAYRELADQFTEIRKARLETLEIEEGSYFYDRSMEQLQQGLSTTT